MALATYGDLQAAVADWLDRDDLYARIPDFITLAEARFNRVLRTDDMEVRATATTTGEFIAFPTGFKGMRSLHVEGSPDDPLEQVSLAALRQQYAGRSGALGAYAIGGGQIILAPVPSTATVLEMIYYTKVPALASNATNWLLTDHPDAYLYGALLQSEAFIDDPARIGLWKSAHDEVVAMINTAARKKQWGGAPIVASANVAQVNGARC